MLSMATLLTAHSRYLHVSSYQECFRLGWMRTTRKKSVVPGRASLKEGRAPQKSARQTFAFVYPLLEAPQHFTSV
jgi:hypothetical protein